MELETGWSNKINASPASEPPLPGAHSGASSGFPVQPGTVLARPSLENFSPRAEGQLKDHPQLRAISCPELSEVGSQLQPILRASLSFLVWPQSLGLSSCPTSLSCLQLPREEAIAPSSQATSIQPEY